ncbi:MULTISPECIES: fumarylacetoacetate hydrolase family protein [unclassified Clostridium]|uniref:fumarylacetoacetate hydrolase family protein n=1 Tax=unclassified Clostridium TaxID=2614128 RepID=UPI0002973E36|nr:MULTISPECIES: fumarylacetoacetate hydrolase family protein [unclassified Clostridium]EKQ57727.1 MAG: 2-keto-4-pentenoate hydratase/2-oxohepta-3-ene-1,7-dioic acid hydratase [Clostridium sp. Maddingley MBC34-26]
MKLVNFKFGEEIRLGIKVEQGIIDVEKTATINSFDVPTTMEKVIENAERGLSQLEGLIKKKVEIIPEEQIIYAPCVNNPEKILCVGLNYLSHKEECNMVTPEFPVLFSKFNNALAAHDQMIKLPKLAEKFDYEAELVIVIGKEAKYVSKEDALSYVFGYTVGNDISARDLQLRTEQWLLGKTCDDFAPIGPYLITADEVNPNNLDIKCEVNGEIRQSANTKDMIFDCATIVSYISQHLTLKPGDIIFTGTPSGVILGYPEAEQCWLKSGDKIKISIEKLGALVNVLE